jgi:hypothetical protein
VDGRGSAVAQQAGQSFRLYPIVETVLAEDRLMEPFCSSLAKALFILASSSSFPFRTAIPTWGFGDGDW